ncbi:hypothetical protein APHAL10511_002256 [Amanita phalloides]|nr:hypothetical protein APHAL10511_002256 [Amanita phalloides]
MDLNLDRLERLVLHLPVYTRPTIHVAGTNGKGSVSAYLSYILSFSQPPLKVGRYNSPHLLVPYDCITVNNEPISAEAYAAARTVIEDLDEKHETKLTSFELLTLTALYVFEEEKVDVAVVEVGMGGRLDATNIIPTSAILASSLTSVDLDHQAFLGPTVSHIAKEKAAIARSGRPFIIGKQRHDEVYNIAQAVIAEKGAFLLPAVNVSLRTWNPQVDGEKSNFSLRNFTEPPHQPISCRLPCFNDSLHALLPLYGNHQLDNVGVALGVISSLFTHTPAELVSQLDLRSRLTPQTIACGIRATRWIGRLSFHVISDPPANIHSESRNTVVLVDGAHNPASSQSLGDYLKHLLASLSPRPRSLHLTYIVAVSHSPPRTPIQTLSPFLCLPSDNIPEIVTRVAVLRFSPPQGMPWIKSVPPSELQQVVSSLLPGAGIKVTSDDEEVGTQGVENEHLIDALKWAVNGALDESLIVVAGSLYLVADFYRYRDRLGNRGL